MTNALRKLTVFIALLVLTLAIYLAATGRETMAAGILAAASSLVSTVHSLLKDCSKTK